MRADEFRAARWVRGGATKKELRTLRTAHRALSYEEQVAEAQRIDSISDHDLAAELAAVRPPGEVDDSNDGEQDDAVQGDGNTPPT